MVDEVRELWEILVPCVRNNGKPIRRRCHQEWDRQVRKISGGLTILKPAIGQWTSPNGELFIERMIPVRIACTRPQIYRIMDLTMKFYDQEAVLCAKVSSEVIIRHQNDHAKL